MSLLSEIFNTDGDDAAECEMGMCADYETQKPGALGVAWDGLQFALLYICVVTMLLTIGSQIWHAMLNGGRP